MLENLSGKRLLILGGIAPMIEVIERARELGIEVLVTDYLENSPAKRYADKSFMVSAIDIDAVVELCKEEAVDGIYTGNVDMLLPYYAQICSRLSLPCYGRLEHFQIMTDKKRFKELCKQYGVPVVQEYTDLEIKQNAIFYPVIVKPIDSSGSRGISICRNKAELEKGIQKALSFSPGKQYIVERYMTGEEVVLYYYFQDGNPVFASMCDRYVNKQQTGVAQLPTAYIFPSKFIETHITHSNQAIKNMFREIGMQDGPIFLQAFIEDGIPYLYEPGYRTNGAREQYIVDATTGISSVDMLINLALTGKMSEKNIELVIDSKLHGKYACKLSPLIREGTIGEIKGIDEIEKLPSVVKVVLNNYIGDTISDKNVGTLKQIAYRAFIVENTKEDLKRTIDYIQNSVIFFDTSGKSMMLEIFDTNVLLKYYR